MLGIQNYGSSSDSEVDETTEEVTSDSHNTDAVAHLKPVDPALSIAKSLAVCAAPEVVPMNACDVSRTIDPTVKEVTYNPKFEELYAPVKGPENPNLTQQMRAPRNTLSGYVEKAHINAFEFENQRRTFHTYGYALDPSVDEVADSQAFVGDLQCAYDDDGKTVFESPKPKKKRKQDKNDNPEDIEGFVGPWGKYQDEQSVARPNEQEKAELEEILAKRHRRNRIVEDKPLEEKSVLHSKFLKCRIYGFKN